MEEMVTYIKSNNEEATIKINTFNRRNLRKKLFEKSNKLIEIKPNIKYIHFQNVDLSRLTNLKTADGIKCNYKTICILENCTIKEPSIRYALLGNHFQLISINAKEISKIRPDYCYEVIIDNSKINNTERNLDIATFNECRKIELKDNQTIKEIYLNCGDVSLSGNFLLDTLIIRSDNKLKIGTNKEETTIIMTDEKYPEINIEANNLELNNCTIINDSTKPTYINYKELSINNFTLKTKGKIIINEVLFEQIKKDKDGYRTITAKDLLRLEVSNQLAKRLTRINQQIKLDTEKYLPQHQNEQLMSNIELQKKIIAQEQSVLKELQEEFKSQEIARRKQITKGLKKKPIKYFDKNK